MPIIKSKMLTRKITSAQTFVTKKFASILSQFSFDRKSHKQKNTQDILWFILSWVYIHVGVDPVSLCKYMLQWT